MPQPNVNTDREREAAEARAKLLSLAEAQGVRPLSFDDLLGEPEPRQAQEEIRREVDDFLALLREIRGGPVARR
jgi:hypothetical protein